MKTDIEIAREAKLWPIPYIAAKLNLREEDISLYGKYKAKIDHRLAEKFAEKPDGKLILVTAMTPTPFGEGKTTVSTGLADALNALGKKAVLCLREPSLGPVFGMKGGAAGGGYAQVVPMEDINLHFTGDLHAISAANNLLAAMVDNHIYHGNSLRIDPRRVTWKRCVDINDRQLRFVTDGLGGRVNGIPREDGFDITAASEVMAIFCLARDLKDLKERLAGIIVGYTYDGVPVTAGQLDAAGSMAVLLKDAFDPNLVQTLEGTPALVHGGPFANIAHGCNSVIATNIALKLGDYVVTEAGFGADLGAEKFFDIKCRKAGFTPGVVVLVATVRALKHHGGCPRDKLSVPDTELLEAGLPNLKRHIENIQKFGLPVCVAVNSFPTDTEEERAAIKGLCDDMDVPCSISNVFVKGGAGGKDLAEAVLKLLEKPVPELKFMYDDSMTLKEKIKEICTTIYRARSVKFTAEAETSLANFEHMGCGNLPVCIAKTQYSFSENAKLLAAPEGFSMTVRSARLSAGAGFVVAIMGSMLTMPGLPKKPAAENIDLDEDGVIQGLF